MRAQGPGKRGAGEGLHGWTGRATSACAVAFLFIFGNCCGGVVAQHIRHMKNIGPRFLLPPLPGHRNRRRSCGTTTDDAAAMRRSKLRLFVASLALVLTSDAASLSARPPITVIGGFLGAGKTAAVTSMLTSRAGLKIAVVCQRGLEPQTSRPQAGLLRTRARLALDSWSTTWPQ